MQFNPACLNGINAGNPNEYMSNPQQTYSDGPPPSNTWSSNVLSLPVYGIYNASLIPVPEAPPNQASDTTSAAKKKNAKRSPQTPATKGSDNSALDESSVPTKPDDKFQGLDEEQKLKRQRRLIKNREAAQQFRQRQKEYIQNLERRVTELNTHVGETHKHIELLTAENRLLRDQLVYLYNVMRQNLSLSTPSLATSTPSSPFHTPTGSVPASPSIPATPPPSPCSPYPAGLIPTHGGIPNTSGSLAAQLSAPITQQGCVIDLSMLGFKGFNMGDSSVSYDLLKMNTPQNPQQGMATVHLGSPPSQSPSAHTPATSPSSLSHIPDLGTLKIDMDNSLLLSRFSNKSNDPNEAQTVPVFVKSEGGGASL